MQTKSTRFCSDRQAGRKGGRDWLRWGKRGTLDGGGKEKKRWLEGGNASEGKGKRGKGKGEKREGLRGVRLRIMIELERCKGWNLRGIMMFGCGGFVRGYLVCEYVCMLVCLM